MIPLILVFSSQAFAGGLEEVDLNSPRYEGVQKAISEIGAARAQQFIDETRRANNGELAIRPHPVVLSGPEAKLIEEGSIQLLRTLKYFLNDIYSGGREFESVLSRPLLKNIMAHWGERLPNPGDLSQKWQIRNIGYFLGPDFVRTRDGFKIMELNVSPRLGGFEEMYFIDRSVQERLPEFDFLRNPEWNAMRFYQNFVRTMKDVAAKFGGVPVVIVPDHETSDTMMLRRQRIVEFYTQMGVIVLQGGYSHQVPGLIQTAHGFEVLRQGQRIKVGTLIVDQDPDRISEYKWGRHLIEMQGTERLASNVSMGTEFLNDKRLLPFLSKLVWLYLGEELLTPPPLTELVGHFNGQHWTNSKERISFMDDPSELDKWVIKSASGHGGHEVYLGNRLNEDARARSDLRELLLSSSWEFVRQRRVELSTIDGLPIDFRSFSIRMGGEYLFGRSLWSRTGTSTGKTNLTTAEGTPFVNPVFIDVHCKDILQGFYDESWGPR